MVNAEKLITDHLPLWSSTVKTKSSAGRGSNKKRELYGIKKLRELILELAVRGLLVPQDPTDEPASELLKKIAAEKATLIKEGKIKKGKKPQPCEEELLFRIPKNWTWTQLGEISEIAPRNTLSDDLEVSFIPMPLISTNYDGTHGQEIKSWREIKTGYTHFADGDIAIAKITPCFENSKAAIFANLENGYGAGTTELHVARLIGEFVSSRFILLYLKAPMFLEKGKPKMTGSAGQKRIPASYFIGNPLPLPPLAEQKRIVAKVDELIALCDRLEQQQEDSIETHETLVKTLLDALTSTSDPAQFQQAWQRIQANFHLLFTTESSIDHLKQTILQLAVMGKLVPQDPNDDARENFPSWKKQASDYLRQDLPRQWMRIPLGKLGEWRGGGTPSKSNTKFWNGDIPWVCPKDMKRHIVHESIDQITEEAINKSSAKLIPMNSLLMVVRGMILAHSFPVARSGREVTINQDMKALLPSYLDTVTYLHLTLNALKAKFLNAVERSSHGTCKLLTKDLQGMLIPIPPLAEQHRIVAKVDELMALCDNLKAKIQSAQTTQRTLTDTLVTQHTKA